MSDALSDALATVTEDVANGRLSPAVGTALAELAARLPKPKSTSTKTPEESK